ncbi:hypothetical protein ABBQ32_009776 [Trebouxia sp. C0010 RCD-2024]
MPCPKTSIVSNVLSLLLSVAASLYSVIPCRCLNSSLKLKPPYDLLYNTRFVALDSLMERSRTTSRICCDFRPLFNHLSIVVLTILSCITSHLLKTLVGKTQRQTPTGCLAFTKVHESLAVAEAILSLDLGCEFSERQRLCLCTCCTVTVRVTLSRLASSQPLCTKTARLNAFDSPHADPWSLYIRSLHSPFCSQFFTDLSEVVDPRTFTVAQSHAPGSSMHITRTWRILTNGMHQHLSTLRLASTCHRIPSRSHGSYSSTANWHSHPVTALPGINFAGQGQLTHQRQTYGQRMSTMTHAAPKAEQTIRTIRSTSPSPAMGRQMMFESLSLESFKMTGVSFEGRQELMLKLQPDQAVMMVKERDNAYDPDAIAVQTLSGQTLGYVPRENTARFPHDTTFGHVYSMGRASSVGLWGATVAVRPSLPPLTLDAIPPNLARHAVMESSLSPEQFQAIREATCKRANHMCEISGGFATEQPAVHEVWHADATTKTFQLRGFIALHPDLHTAANLELQQDAKPRSSARLALEAINA